MPVMAMLPYGVKVAQLSLAQLVGVRVLVGQLWGVGCCAIGEHQSL